MKEHTMKIYLAETMGDAISVKTLDVVEKPKTYQVISKDGMKKFVSKDLIGFVSPEYVYGYGLTPEQAIETFRKSAEMIREKYQRNVNFYDKLANLPVEAS